MQTHHSLRSRLYTSVRSYAGWTDRGRYETTMQNRRHDTIDQPNYFPLESERHTLGTLKYSVGRETTKFTDLRYYILQLAQACLAVG